MDGVKLVKTKESNRKGTERSLTESVEELVDTHDVELEIAGTKVTVSPKETGEVTLTLGAGDKLEEGRSELI